jgi:DNA-binding MarR family transcriptional regulator
MSFEDGSGNLAERLASGLAKLGMAVKTEAWRAAASWRLSPTQAQVLAVLSALRRPARLQEVARYLAITPATASDSVSALEAKSLVTKRAAADDARARAIALTPAGARAAQELATWPDFLLPAIESLSEDEQAVLLRATVKMVRTLQLEGRIPLARMCLTCTYFSPNRYPGSDKPHHCGFVGEPFADVHLRLDCPDYSPASGAQQQAAWQVFSTGAVKP